MQQFERYIGIDYSGAETPDKSLKGLRIYMATKDQAPAEVLPPAGPRKYWSRRGIADWLVAELSSGPATLVGIDHAFSFPMRYFLVHGLQADWSVFLEDFQQHWPTDEKNMYVDFVREGRYGKGMERMGDSRWRRMAEERSRAKSVFHFDVQGSVAKSTHSGLPWLLHLRRQFGERLHFWPFDGWAPPAGRSVIAEVYPALWNRIYPMEDRDSHQQDAYSVSRWMRQADAAGSLETSFHPELSEAQRKVALVEGWILGLG